ncbi:MAG TPA: hypothetical protein HA362_06080 [Nanoarchaeota archaeon]|nr:hypothetical protein [Nanoarchaeota archaeon]
MEEQSHSIKLFESRKVKAKWVQNEEKWYFSIIDVIAVLTDSPNPQTYWRVLKMRLKAEGNETVTNCNALKLPAPDGKMRFTDVADTEQLLRLIQSIPSKKAEPFKAWLAKVGYERIEETEDPELAFGRAMKTYLQKGYSKEWVNQRLKTIEVRKELTDEWNRAGIEKESDFAILTNEITKAWSGRTVSEYKQLKNLKKESLRDNMTNMELVLNMLAEATTSEISKKQNPKTFNESRHVAVLGGNVAGNTRKDIEKQLGKSVVSAENYLKTHGTEKKIESKKQKLIEKK